MRRQPRHGRQPDKLTLNTKDLALFPPLLGEGDPSRCVARRAQSVPARAGNHRVAHVGTKVAQQPAPGWRGCAP